MRFEKGCIMEGSVTPNIKNKLSKATEQSRLCRLTFAWQSEFEVMDEGMRYVMNLTSKTCNCKVW